MNTTTSEGFGPAYDRMLISGYDDDDGAVEEETTCGHCLGRAWGERRVVEDDLDPSTFSADHTCETCECDLCEACAATAEEWHDAIEAAIAINEPTAAQWSSWSDAQRAAWVHHHGDACDYEEVTP